ncbi:MAG: 30S ribosomal protein S7 [Dehalococcoidales bacterium]|nr:30S ribosomal protein S7 [Dehalococcoidales bacterium]
MPRRAAAVRKIINPDAKYNNVTVSILINRIMKCGKKSTAERVVYGALDLAEKQESKAAVTVLEQAIKNVTPLLEVKSRRIGGASYQVPLEVRTTRGMSLAMRWLTNAARARSGQSMMEKLAAEISAAANNQGAAIKRREDTHRMAEANRAFAHFKW